MKLREMISNFHHERIEVHINDKKYFDTGDNLKWMLSYEELETPAKYIAVIHKGRSNKDVKIIVKGNRN